MLYAPVRFLLDGLRNVDLEHQDARYLGLTPAQYFCVGMFFAGAALMASRDWRGFRPWALDGEPDQARRARETAEIPADVEPTA
jgi:phosphatidylglycerol:prolipoprotein diacylglycerol transferase